MQSMTLKEIATAVGGTFQGAADTAVYTVCTDTRNIVPGCLFVPIQGERFDGHDFLEQAFEAGAAAALCHKNMRIDKPIVYVKDTRLAFGALSGYYRNRFSFPVVGVTGSVGKTSTKEMIATVLEGRGEVLKTAGNFNNDIGLPHTLFGLSEKNTAAVIEMGMSDLGEISYLSRLTKPTIGVITNVGVSHLENLKTRDNILHAKLELLDGMAPETPLILNADNDKLREAIPLLGSRVRSFGIEQEAEIKAGQVEQVEDCTRFVIYYNNNNYPAEIPTIGIHNVYNALAAFWVGIEVGMEPEEIVARFCFYENAGLRQKQIETDGVKVIADCYNASPDSMQSALSVIQSIHCTGKRYAVLGDMLELGETSSDLHYAVGTQAASGKLETVFCYGQQAAEIANGVTAAGGKAIHSVDADELAEAIRAVVRPGDAIIFKASRGMRLEGIMKAVFPKIKEL